MSAIVVLFFLLSRFALVQTWLPVLDKWRYMYVSFFAEKIVFIGVLMYLLMRLPNCDKILNRGGVSMKSTRFKEVRSCFVGNLFKMTGSSC